MTNPSLLYLFLLCSQCIPAISQLQFITYNGSITGTFQLGASSPSSCQSYYLSPNANATIQVGINPPWETNPFYFSLFASGNLAHVPFPECVATCTFDSICGLSFISADDVCFLNETGQECNGIYSPGQAYYLPIEVLNLKEATVSPIQLAGESGYSVSGNQSTSGNLTVDNGFRFQQPHNYTLAGVTPCFDASLFFSWNSSTPFTYALNFTNSTTSALFTLTAPYGVVSMSFFGSRVDDLNNQHNPVNPFDNGNYTTIALNSSNPKVPGFMFVNGSRIEFNGDVAFASQSSSGGQMVVGMQWFVMLMIVGLASLVVFF
ncbi:hypothetical protein N431DRAFT_363280 [Stipitochalara longipes BDJ]|nr:hypothetical protein N431DRAFT_363280 [Stipitochalara longipes BDJ]